MRNHIRDKSAYNRLLNLVDAAVVLRIKHGEYFFGEASRDPRMIDVEKIVSGGVLCLYSAWEHNTLTVQIPNSFPIAIEKAGKYPFPVILP